MKNEYLPDTIDTEGVVLSPDIRALGELLARNVHETWAKKRMAEGWTYGAARSDAKKLHPCLVPYDALPESEKEYDRASAVETLKVIAAMGYQIIRAEHE